MQPHEGTHWISANNPLRELLKIWTLYLISVNKYYFVHSQWEKDIQEEDFVTPDDPLLFRLLMKPMGPFVLYKLILESIFFCHVRDNLLQNRRRECYERTAANTQY